MQSPSLEENASHTWLNRAILRLAIPNIISNISIPLLGMVDTALMGRLESEVYIGAVALGSIIFNFIYWGFGFLRMGTTGLTAQAFGRREKSECSAILGRGLLLALGLGVLLIALQKVIVFIGFGLIHGEARVEELAQGYFLIRIYAAPATLALYVIQGWFLGMQNARYPMWLTVLVNIINIFFNIFFVYALEMKADGVALGTVCAQYLGVALAGWLFWRRYRRYGRSLHFQSILHLQALKRFFSVNFDIFLRTICLVFTFAFFTAASASLSSLILAANQILLQYISLMSYAVDGFAFAAESLVGRFIGARQPRLLRLAVVWLFIWGWGWGAFFALLYGLFGRPLLHLFTNQTAIIQTAQPFLWWMILLPLAGSVAYLWDGVYIGATATKAMRNWMLVATLLVFLPTYYLSIGPLGNHGLWLALFLFMVARGLSLGLQAKRSIFLSLEKALSSAQARTNLRA